MILSDMHMHTSFCDGKNSPEEMVLAAIDKGLKTVGISGHCNTGFDESYCMTREVMKKYFDEMHRLKEVYRDKIEILCGIEQDYYSIAPLDYEYILLDKKLLSQHRHYLACKAYFR